MSFVFETVKILLLSLIVLLLSIDLGLVPLPKQSDILERLGMNGGEVVDSIELETLGSAQQFEALGYEGAETVADDNQWYVRVFCLRAASQGKHVVAHSLEGIGLAHVA